MSRWEVWKPTTVGTGVVLARSLVRKPDAARADLSEGACIAENIKQFHVIFVVDRHCLVLDVGVLFAMILQEHDQVARCFRAQTFELPSDQSPRCGIQ